MRILAFAILWILADVGVRRVWGWVDERPQSTLGNRIVLLSPCTPCLGAGSMYAYALSARFDNDLTSPANKGHQFSLPNPDDDDYRRY